MKTFIVSLDIYTNSSVTDVQVAELLGVEKSLLISREIDSEVLWKLESNVEEDSSLTSHMESITSMFPSEFSLQKNNIIKEIFLVVGVFYDTFTCTVRFPVKSLALIEFAFPGINVEIACYPCSEESP